MNQTKTGALIAARRRALGLTQVQLAERLNITDRAVSKWETGKSLPDAALMLELCALLGVTADELLRGGADRPLEAASPAAAEKAVFPRRGPEAPDRRRIWAAALFTGALALGSGVCLLCDAVLFGRMTWSAIAMSSMALAWAVGFPALLWRQGVRRSLLALSGCLLPYLFLLSVLLHRPEVFSVGGTAAVPALVFLWLAWAVLTRKGKEGWAAGLGICFLLGIPLLLAVNVTLSWTLGEPLWDVWDLLSALSLLACAASAFLWDRVRRR